jgi:broad specificity phosphatase PhoE
MPAILLIRHGQASFGLGNYDKLSTLGEQQAVVLGKHLSTKQLNIGQVFMGTMQRHRQTAELSLKETNKTIRPIVLPEWDEFDHEQVLEAYNPRYKSMVAVGVDMALTGNPKAAFQKIFSAAVQRWVSGEHDSDYRESWTAFNNRVREGLLHVMEHTPKGTVSLVYTSGGTISSAARHLLQLSDENTLQLQWRMANCAICRIQTGLSGTFLSTMNEYGFLEHQPGLVTFR